MDLALATEIGDRLVGVWAKSHDATVYLPLSIGAHVDHTICASAAHQLRSAGARVWYYEDLPYVALVPGSGAARLSEIAPNATPHLFDVSPTMDLRLRAIACHASQANMLVKGSTETTEALVLRYAASLAQSPAQYAERCWQAPSS